MTISEVSISNAINSKQKATTSLKNGIHHIERINSSRNSIDTNPSFSSTDALSVTVKMLFICDNNVTEGLSYYQYENAIIVMCTFESNKMTSIDGYGAISIKYANATLYNCNFLMNEGPLFWAFEGTTVCKKCFFDGNKDYVYTDIVIEETAEKNMNDVIIGKCYPASQKSLLAHRKRAVIAFFIVTFNNNAK